jgi:hypothetical protein
MNVRELAQKLAGLDAEGYGDLPVVWLDRSRDVLWTPQEFMTIEVDGGCVELDL